MVMLLSKYATRTAILAGSFAAVISIASIATAKDTVWKLVWSDEFDYLGHPDSKRWAYDVGGHGWGNQELQFYTERRLANARVEDGLLNIEARHEPWKGKEYTSARLVTKGKGEWQYGKVVVKAVLPKGRGTWPAIWMLGATTPLRWPDDGEIDIMEHVGFDQGTIHASIHCRKYYFSIGTQKTAQIEVPDCSDSFHEYAVEWNAARIRITVDGDVYFAFNNEDSGREAWPFDNKMYLLLNIAVGGNWGGQKGVDEAIWPQQMKVDYVRVYEAER
jgi:beta-glucanase (GH16 family)